MGKGYNGKILRVDLSERKVETEAPEELIYRKYLGGSGLAAYYLLKELPKDVDPLSPDNILVLAASVITGTPVPGASRFTAAAKSPLTGGYGEAEAGGWWAPELKRAGYDAIIIKGKASEPVYIWIHNGEVEIRDASKMWGMITGDAQKAIREELDDNRIRILQIGPGGEKLVRYACIINELKHANGRTGMGAVMGSKNLKAIAVRGTNKPEMADPDAMRAVNKWLGENYEYKHGDMHDMGTARLTPSLSENGILPTRNFREGSFDEAYEISGEKMKDTILVRRGTCFACTVTCKREVEVNEGPYKVSRDYGGPEYETVAALGSLCGIGDLKAVAKGNELCNKYTIDTISTGVSIAFAMECYENGIITKEDTGGIDLKFGNADAMVKMVEMIGKREGLGDILAEGVKRAAEKFGNGAEKFAIHVKGQEVPMHEARGKRSLILAYSLSPTGADHMESPHDVVYELFNPEGQHPLASLGLLEPVDTLDMGPLKVRSFYYTKQLFDFYNSIGMCDFVGVPIGPLAVKETVKLVKAVTGWDTSLWELLKAGERANVMLRLFNFREGFTKADDTLPERLFRGLENGPLKGKEIDREDFEQMKEMYYKMAGWDEDGYPTEAKIAELGLEWVESVM
jgi:aldehyde:ferredoxin oxidoreductase